MRHQAQLVHPGGGDAVAFEMRQKVAGLLRLDLHEDHVGVHRLYLHAGQTLQAIGKAAGVGMVVGQPFHMMLQRVQAGRRQQARLPHAAAHHLAPATRPGNEVAAAQQHAADRRPQALAQAHADTVKAGHQTPFRCLQCLAGCARSHYGIEQACAVQMRLQTMLAGQRPGLNHIRRRQHLAANAVFKRQQTRARKVRIIGLDGGGDAGQRQAAIGIMVQRLRLNTAQHRRTTGLPLVAVRFLTDDVLVAALAMAHERDQVALRAAGAKKPGFKSHARGQCVLQQVDAGVIAKHVVAQRRCQHGFAHARGGLGHGIAAQVNQMRCHGWF